MRVGSGRDRDRGVRRALHAAPALTEHGAARRADPPWWSSLLAAVPAMAVAALLASRIPGPSLLWDGQGYLGAARWFARDDWPLLGELDFYHPAYGALLAPSIWLGASPMGLFRWAQAVNVLAIGVLAGALAVLATSLGLRGRVRAAAVAAGAAYPAVLVQAGFEWPETPFVAVFAVAAACAWRERDLPLAVAAASLYALHPRGLGVLALTVVLLAARRRWTAAAVGAAGFAGVQLLNRAALAALYNPDRESATTSVFDKIADPATWPDIALRAAGHGWYLLVATLGLAGVAVWAALGDRRPPALWLLGALGALLLASALQLAGRGRADHAIYGRYVEAAAPVLIVVAATALRRRRFPVVVGGALVVAALLGAVTRIVNGAEGFDGTVAWINVVVLHALGGIGILGATAAAVAAAAIVAVVAARSPASALVLVAVAGLAAAVSVHGGRLESFAAGANGTYLLGDDVARFSDDGVVAYDVRAYDKLASNRYQWQHPGLELPYWSGGEPPADVILSTKSGPPVPGARIVAAERIRDLALWVVPGPLHDELSERGWLVARHGDLGDAFFDARVEVVGDGLVRVHHAGGEAPWVPEGLLEGSVGIVRVLADGTPVHVPDLVRPGESVVVTVPAGTRSVMIQHVHDGRLFGRIDLAR